MEYKLTITKIEKNPKFSPKRDLYYHGQEEPEYNCHELALQVQLNDAEFTAIKKAVIEVIK